jgi:diguanylate cyclase (GGDEF)-like protein/PAS domain S-box-containing protein
VADGFDGITSCTRIKALLIDDDAIYAVFLRALVQEIEGASCEFEWVDNFSDGLRAIERRAHDVYLIDYQLDQDDGLQLMRTTQQQDLNLPMILLTSTGGHDLYLQAMDVGASGYLVKQEITASLLERSIRHAIKHTQALESLRLSEERYAAAVKSTNDGIWDWDLRTGEVYYSARWKAILGYAEDELGGSPDEWYGRVHKDDLTALMADFAAHVNGERAQFVNEHRMRHRDGNYRWMRTQGLLVPRSRVAGSMTDITDRKRFEADLLHNALHDSLTGLPNRRFFLERLRNTLDAVRQRQAAECAVLFLDLDRFKVVNDSLGHPAGDELLRQFAERLRQALQADDMVARLGGDEFAILLRGVNTLEYARATAARVAQAIQQPIVLRGHEFSLTSSIGIVVDDGRHDPEDLLRNADIALYEAKASDKARYAVFDQAMFERVTARLRLESELHRALERGEFVLYYQPICSSEQQVVGFESLIRWQHPERGLVPPGEFITCVEETGLIVPLGWWILQESCRGIQTLRAAIGRPLSISVNLSASQFAQADLVPRIQTTLQRTGLEPASLRLEITESVLMDRSESSIAKLKALRALGVCCHIDDFGTGYSSLSYLYHLPSDALKIDRSFVAKILENRENQAIIKTIVTLAHNLDMYVIAEGVETRQQFEQIKSMGCEYYQGYWFSQPLSLADAVPWLTATATPLAEHAL